MEETGAVKIWSYDLRSQKCRTGSVQVLNEVSEGSQTGVDVYLAEIIGKALGK